MRIALLSLGSYGDVLPFVTLGKALKNRGHDVVISTAKNYTALINASSLRFAPIEVDYQELIKSDEGKKLLKANPFAIQRNLNTFIYPLIEQSLNAFYDLAKHSDQILFHVKTMADAFADQFPQKMMRAMVVPAVQPTHQFLNPAFSGLALPKRFSMLSYKLTELSMRMFAKPVHNFRKAYGLSQNSKRIELPFIYGISPSFLPKPADYPAESFYTGFWFDDNTEEMSKELAEFLQLGDPPVLITFGSMPFQSNINLPDLLNPLVEQLQLRLIIIKGWGLDSLSGLEKNKSVKLIDAAPYNKLLPHVKAVIHHGGLGTTAECIRAGKPMLICPVLYPVGDQFFWGNLAYHRGIAVKPLPVKKINLVEFIKRVTELVNRSSLYEKSNQLSQEVLKENGIENAIHIIENHAKKRG